MVSIRASQQTLANTATTVAAARAPASSPKRASAAPTDGVSYIASPALMTRAWARLSGRAFSVFPPVAGAGGVLGLLPTYYRHGIDGVVETLWRNAVADHEFSYGWVADQLVVCLRSPALVHQVFNAHSQQTSRLFPDYKGPFGGIYRVFGRTLFTEHGDAMKKARQMIMHRFFLRRTIEAHVAKITATADAHVGALVAATQGTTLDVSQTMVAFTMDTWCRVQLGLPGLSRQAAQRLSVAISDCEALATSARQLIWRGVLAHLRLRSLGTTDSKEAALRQTMRRAMEEELITPNLPLLKDTDNLLRALACHEAEAGRDGSFTGEAVLTHLSILLLTGHETAASLLTWTLYEMSRHPRVEQRVREEIARCCGAHPPTVENLHNLSYLDHVMQEVLRLHPPAPYLGRTVTEEFALQTRHGAIVVPPGTVLATSLIDQHLLPHLWGDDAAEFRPERFAEISKSDLETQYMPFSVGERRCPGYPFALLEARIFLVRFLQSLQFSIPNASTISQVYAAVLKIQGSMDMRVHAL